MFHFDDALLFLYISTDHERLLRGLQCDSVKYISSYTFLNIDFRVISSDTCYVWRNIFENKTTSSSHL